VGLDVPTELSVMGFDDLEVAAHVGLTTVRQPLHETGRVGGERILAALRGEPPPAGTTVLPLRVVVRSTTDRVPAHV
jgi:LacI family transcriptional regulator